MYTKHQNGAESTVSLHDLAPLHGVELDIPASKLPASDGFRTDIDSTSPYYDNRLSDPPTNECAMPDTAEPTGDDVCVDRIQEPWRSQRIRKQPERLVL